MATDEAAVAERPSRARAAEAPRPSAAPAPAEPARPKAPAAARVPTLLDFYPLEDAKSTQLSAFFEALRAGRFTTTRCRKTGRLLWPPRLICPDCHDAELDWVELPTTGSLYAFSAVLVGAPLGMEADVPFCVGLVDLDGVPLRLFGRIDGAPWDRLAVGDRVRLVPLPLEDGRIFYRFRLEAPSTAGPR
jgi:uncharacterized OB-fold protein